MQYSMFDRMRQQIESRAKRFGPMRDANGYAKLTGSCGDTVEIWLRIDGGRIRKGSFMNDGCGWSKQCCNMAVELAEGLKPEEIETLTPERVLEAAGNVPQEYQHCATLAVDAIRLAVENYLHPPTRKSLWKRIAKLLKI